MKPEFVVFGLWLVFWLVWAVASFNVKKDVGGLPSWLSYVFRFVIVAMVVFAIDTLAHQHRGYMADASADFFSPPLRYLGLALCAAGIAFAIWARVHLGRNWSPMPAIKEEHELVTSGPYKYVRHPIYGGMIVAMIGSALAAGPYWLVGVVVCVVVFLFRVRKEEGFMTKLFPSQYPAYRQRTKALIPYVV